MQKKIEFEEKRVRESGKGDGERKTRIRLKWESESSDSGWTIDRSRGWWEMVGGRCFYI